MHLQPFLRVDDTPFTLSPQALARHRGSPGRMARNNVDLTEWDYGDVVYRFQDSGRLEEVTCQVRVLHLDSVAIPFAALKGFVSAHDDEAFTRAGFVVSPRFGLAFVPDCPHWVTALASHCIGAWRAL